LRQDIYQIVEGLIFVNWKTVTYSVLSCTHTVVVIINVKCSSSSSSSTVTVVVVVVNFYAIRCKEPME